MSRQLMILANSYGRFLIFIDAIKMLLKGKQSAFTLLHSIPTPMAIVCVSVPTSMVMIVVRVHIFLFFIIRSEHDNLLSWPFKQSVRFTLINQKTPAASITEAFAPDLHSPSFQKPEYNMNIASGFPRFAPQMVLQDENFTLKNTVIIHCHIDPNGLALL